jgi:hypothetical protein
MIDWMIEVMSTFRCSTQALFLAVQLMDRHFGGSLKTVQVGDLHLTGVATMFIASKFEDVYPLIMKTVFKKIGHGKLSVEQIKLREAEVLQNVEYFIATPTSWEFYD